MHCLHVSKRAAKDKMIQLNSFVPGLFPLSGFLLFFMKKNTTISITAMRAMNGISIMFLFIFKKIMPLGDAWFVGSLREKR